jgi:hypothetical protein
MYKRLIIPAAALITAFGSAVPRAAADQTFHTERIPLLAVNGAPLHKGFVVDVHTEGQKLSAIERYVLVGAAPNTTYQVQLSAYPDTACAQTPLVTIQEAKLVTNVVGNGEAGFTFPAAPAPAPGTFNLQWHVLNGGTIAYQTACTLVAVG